MGYRPVPVAILPVNVIVSVPVLPKVISPFAESASVKVVVPETEREPKVTAPDVYLVPAISRLYDGSEVPIPI